MRRYPPGHILSEATKRTYYRLATNFGAPTRKLLLTARQTQPFRQIKLKNYVGDAHIRAKLLEGHFQFANQELDIGAQGDPWTIPAPSERFAYWLHSFDWMPHLTFGNDKAAFVRARYLVDRWIEIYGDWNSYAWENDIIANRLFMWLTNWAPGLSVDNLSDLAQRRRNAVVRQLKRLRGTFSRTPQGLPRLKAAATLILGGVFVPGDNDTFLNRGLDWLDNEIEQQILPDGGHISRSPAQTLEALYILTLVDDALGQAGIEATRMQERALERLRHIIPFFILPNGTLPGFNGGGDDRRLQARRLLSEEHLSARPFTYCPHLGYQRIALGQTFIHVDTGETPPPGADQHAHLAPLAFEMSTEAGPLLVNCGWSPEQPLRWRKSMRETAAHNTLVLNGLSAGQLITSGLREQLFEDGVLKGVSDVKASRMEQSSGVWLDMSHNGYEARTGLVHQRRLFVTPDGNDIRGEDTLLVPIGKAPLSRDEIPFDVRFHLHPKVRATVAQDMNSALLIQPGKVAWRFRTDSGPITIEPSVYLGAGDKPARTEQIRISGRAFADSDGETRSNRIRWSIKRLEQQ